MYFTWRLLTFYFTAPQRKTYVTVISSEGSCKNYIINIINRRINSTTGKTKHVVLILGWTVPIMEISLKITSTRISKKHSRTIVSSKQISRVICYINLLCIFACYPPLMLLKYLISRSLEILGMFLSTYFDVQKVNSKIWKKIYQNIFRLTWGYLKSLVKEFMWDENAFS